MNKEINENCNESLRQEIITMVDEDQKMRKSHNWDLEIDERNTKKMKEIISQFGWPLRSVVGKDGADGAWLLAQHADHDADFQKLALELLKDAVSKNEAEKKHEAYLTDRVRVNTGEAQIFGTQFYTNEEGVFGPRPIEDMENLDKRRLEYGLEPFSDYQKFMIEVKKKRFDEKEAKKQNA
jgi:hypothetical protein